MKSLKHRCVTGWGPLKISKTETRLYVRINTGVIKLSHVTCQILSGSINCPLLFIFMQGGPSYTEKPWSCWNLREKIPASLMPLVSAEEQSPHCWFSSPLDDEASGARTEDGGQVGEPCFCQTASHLSENCADPVSCEMVCWSRAVTPLSAGTACMDTFSCHPPCTKA